ncbi:EscU/YscU/HrcU family type III secretion system export apparatus switch protein [Aliikangiella sp. G2MR2-5]|uniref:EscU/YscU/HrcU family type III secretion system export apparatus switch protein n=1 Tax=Aliikangiella sp. G2MR2-5 TaxID=2788943 RepID=UPI0018AA6DE1
MKSKNRDKPENKAAALKFDGINAPKLVAKGSGEQAKQIIQLALENNVHIHNDPMLVSVLSRLELGEEIPEQLYLTVAKIIAFAYFLQSQKSDGYHTPTSSILNSVEPDNIIDPNSNDNSSTQFLNHEKSDSEE